MTEKEAAGLWATTPENIRVFIKTGLALPKSQKRVKLKATAVGKRFDISEQQLLRPGRLMYPLVAESV